MNPPPVRGRNVSIAQAIEQTPELRKAMDTNPQVKDLIDLARRLEGCARHASVHAAGVVITPEPLEELIPIAVSGRDEVTTQYEMSDLEKVGVLKMDFLALNTRSEEHTSELQSPCNLVCRLLLEKKKT